MTFKQDLNLEEQFYRKIFKPYLNSRNKDSIFIHFNSNSIVYQDIQKEHDIDIILDNGKENITISLKTRRKNYGNDIFFETVSNCNTGSLGWGYYSKADYIVYSIMLKNCISFVFKLADVLVLDIKKYPKKYGQTRGFNNNLLYQTEGRIIPLHDFKHTIINYNSEEI